MQKARNPAVQTTVKLLPLLFKASKFYTGCNDNDGNDFVRGSDIPSRLVALWSPLQVAEKQGAFLEQPPQANITDFIDMRPFNHLQVGHRFEQDNGHTDAKRKYR